MMRPSPIVLRETQLKAARAGKRTHICVPAWHRGSRRVSVADPGAAVAPASVSRVPTSWQGLQHGDRLWVQEEMCELRHSYDASKSQLFYSADLDGGRPSIPNGGYRRGRWSTAKYAAENMPRQASRYTLRVIRVRQFSCQDITWEEVAVEGPPRFATDSKSAWWHRAYGVLLPWASNVEVVGIDFEFLAETIEGVPFAAPAARKAGNVAALLDSFYPPKPGEALDRLDDGDA